MSATDRAAFRALAAELDGVDREVYETFGVDPLEPILGDVSNVRVHKGAMAASAARAMLASSLPPWRRRRQAMSTASSAAASSGANVSASKWLGVSR